MPSVVEESRNRTNLLVYSLLSIRYAIVGLLPIVTSPHYECVRRGGIQLVDAIEDALRIERTYPSRAERRAEERRQCTG